PPPPGPDADPAQRLAIHTRLRLAAAELALDEDRAEVTREVVALDLVALLKRIAIGHERQRQAARAQRIQERARLGKEPHRVAPARRVLPRDGGRQRLVGAAAARERLGDHLGPGAGPVPPPARVPPRG